MEHFETIVESQNRKSNEIMKKEEEEIVTYESQNESFSKSNTLISSKYKASLVEQKILNIVLARLQQKNYIDKGEHEGLVCEIRASELKKLLGVTAGSFYSQLKPVAAAMTSRTIGYVNDELEEFKYISLITAAEYINGVLRVKFNYEFKKHLNPKTQFTVLELPIMLQYRSMYSLRLHEILLSRCYKKKKVGTGKLFNKESDGKHFKIEIGLSELKLSLGVVNAESNAVQKILNGSSAPDYDKAVEKASEKSFSTWYEFRRKVIEVAVNEINEINNGLTVSYEPQKGGKGGRVYGIIFYVDFTEDKEDDEVFEEIEYQEPVKKRELTEDEKFEVQFNVKSLIKEPIILKDIRSICEAAEYDFDVIKKAYEVAEGTANITNFVGFMIQAIKDNYSAPIKKKKKSAKNQFNDFDQREYDFDEFEKTLLNDND